MASTRARKAQRKQKLCGIMARVEKLHSSREKHLAVWDTPVTGLAALKGTRSLIRLRYTGQMVMAERFY